MLRNYTTLTDLKAYIPNLDNLLWTENEDYSAQIEAAEREVRDDLLNTGLRGTAPARSDFERRHFRNNYGDKFGRS